MKSIEQATENGVYSMQEVGARLEALQEALHGDERVPRRSPQPGTQERRLCAIICVYQAVWLISLAVLALLMGRISPADPRWRTLEMAVACLAWGAAGGAIASVVAAVGHLAGRRFDMAYVCWHAAKPVIGAFLGGFTYLLFLGGADGNSRTSMAYAVAALCGFQERAVIGKLKQLMSAIFGGDEGRRRGPALTHHSPLITHCSSLFRYLSAGRRRGVTFSDHLRSR